jgi:hypothetical protein
MAQDDESEQFSISLPLEAIEYIEKILIPYAHYGKKRATICRNLILELHSAACPAAKVLGGKVSKMTLDNKTPWLEHVPNKFPEISPNVGGGNAICSRLDRGGEGCALAKKHRLLGVSGAAGQY